MSLVGPSSFFASFRLVEGFETHCIPEFVHVVLCDIGTRNSPVSCRIVTFGLSKGGKEIALKITEKKTQKAELEFIKHD